MLDSLVGLLVVVLVFGVILYLIEAVLPTSPPFKVAARIVVGLILILYLLRFAGFVRF